MAARALQPRWLVGKTIARVEMNATPNGRGGTCHAPRITFTDGSAITFNPEPVENSEGGVGISYWPSTETR